MKRYTEWQVLPRRGCHGENEQERAQLFGHIKRMSNERMAKKIYDKKVSGNRGRGRPRLNFENTVSKILQ